MDDAERVLPDKDAEIVVYCINVDCEASTAEARELEGMGYRNVRHYAEGKHGPTGPASPSRTDTPRTEPDCRERGAPS